MAKHCEICGKVGVIGSSISHAHNVNKTRRLPNLQNVKAVVDGRPQRLVVCTRCLRSGKVVKSGKVSQSA